MNTRSITEGALTCALSVILALAGYYMPFMLILFLFIPVPIVILAKRRGFLPALISGAAAAIICFFLTEPVTAAGFGIYILTMGCGLGYTYAKQKTGAVRVAVGFFAALLTLVVYIVLTQMITGVMIIDEISNQITLYSDAAIRLYNNFGLNENNASDVLSQIIVTTKMMIPVAAVSLPAVISWINVLICDKLLARLNEKNIPLTPLKDWIIPRSLRTFLILLVFAELILSFSESKAVPEIYIYTIMQLMELFYIVMGWSVLFWFFARKFKKDVPMANAAVIIATFIIPFFSSILSWIGLAEVFLSIKTIFMIKDAMK